MRDQSTKNERSSEIRDLEKYSEATNGPAMVTYMEPDAKTGPNLRDYWRSIVSRKWLVIGIVLSLTLLTAWYLALKPDLYQSSARVQVDLENSIGFGVSSKGGQVIMNPGSDPAYFNTQLQILTSPTLLRRVVKTLDLEHNKTFRRSSAQSISAWDKLRRVIGLQIKDAKQKESPNEALLTDPVAPPTSREDLAEIKRLEPFVRIIEKGLVVTPVRETRLPFKETRLIDISFTHSDKQITAKVVNAIADTFALSNMERRSQASQTTGDFLQNRIAELQAQIRNGEERLINYANNHQILSLDPNQNTVVDRLGGLNRQLLTAENERKLAEAAYRAALAPGAANALVENTPQLMESENRLANLRQKRAELLVENTAEWPEVKEVTQQIVVLEKQTAERRDRAISVLVTNRETEYRRALASEKSIRETFDQQRKETLAQNEAAINYRIIQQEVDTNKSLVDGLMQRSKENDVTLAGLAGTLNNINVVDYASPPDNPIGAPRLLLLILVAIMSLGFGIGCALFLDYIDDTVQFADEVEKALYLPALATVPYVGRLMPSVRELRERALSFRPFSRRRRGVGVALLSLKNGNSPFSETFRQLRTSIVMSVRGENAPKTLLVTSSEPAEGKTTTAVNMAVSLRKTGATVLLIDADLRHPNLHTLFGLQNENGLSDILATETDDNDLLKSIKRDEASGLDILPAGMMPQQHAELLDSPQMVHLLSRCSSNYSYVVIDSSPIGYFTDSVILSSLVDGVVLVARSGKSTLEILRHSQRDLQNVGARIIGFVLNGARKKLPEYSYYYN